MTGTDHTIAQKAQNYLTRYGIRPSLQRMAVMEYLMTHKTHPTVDEIYLALAPAIPTLSRTTVYNTLATLADCGAILALDMGAGRIHYDGDNSPHAHFLCTRCGVVHDIFPEPRVWDALCAAMPAPAGASVAATQFCYKGVCAECNAAPQIDN